MLVGMVEYGEMSRDMKRMNLGTSMKEKCVKIPSSKVVHPEIKIDVLRSNHMSQLRVKHVSPLHSNNMKVPLKCHHCDKFGHIRSNSYDLHGYLRLDSSSKLMNRRCNKLQENKKLSSNDTSTSYITHTS